MNDLYALLGLNKNASEKEIKRAYKDMARVLHPDKETGNSERMTLLNEAHEKLLDPEKRRQFDEDWKVFCESGEGQEPTTFISGRLDTAGVPFSKAIREKYIQFVRAYRAKPIKQETAIHHFKPHYSSLYPSNKNNMDLFSWIKEKSRATPHPTPLKKYSRQLTLSLAIEIFTQFLSGDFYGRNLIVTKGYLSSEISRIKSSQSDLYEINLYEAIFDIVGMVESPENNEKLLLSIKKIIDYAKRVDDQSMRSFSLLFQSKYFRNLLSKTLHQYWMGTNEFLTSKNDDFFDGKETTKVILNNFRMQLSQTNRGESYENLRKHIRYLRMLYQFEKDVDEGSDATPTAKFYREKAFHILDWIPAFLTTSRRHIITNVIFRAAVYFQKASLYGKSRSRKMADEKIACELFLSATMNRQLTPDIEFYACIHSLKYMAQFQFQTENLSNIITSLQRRALILADIFPFFDPIKSNISLLMQENESIILMRRLLHNLIDIIESNSAQSNQITIDHDYVTVLYQAYEANLKNWYEERYNPKTEEKIRVDLMRGLLAKKNWKFSDLERNINFPWIMVGRDKEGWMIPTDSLPFPNHPFVEKFCSIDGFEFNYKTGNINLLFKPANQEEPYESLITIFDLRELLEKNIQAAIFSLDPVDPEKPYHPFNEMYFSPSSLYQTTLMHTMFLTDYLLKFFTIKQEVQGKHPYAMRSLNHLTRHLPLYLKKIIDDFHSAQQSESLHRFWIEAVELPVGYSVEKKGWFNHETHRFALGPLRMVVRKHCMARDINGNLIDVEEAEEGWNCYVLSPEELKDYQSGKRKLQSPGMIFIRKNWSVYFLEDGKLSQEFMLNVVNTFRTILNEFFMQNRDKQGRFIKDIENSYLIYRVIREVTEQSNKLYPLRSIFRV